MKRLTLILTSLMLLAGLTANAQMGHGKDMDKPMMKQGMMHKGMMCPMHKKMMDKQMPMKKYMMMVNMLPEMNEKLDLSQEQTEKLIDMQAGFKKQQIDYKADLAKKKMKLQNMLMNEASADEVRNHMEECSTIKINMKVAAYETANKMKAVLTSEQQEMMKDMMMPKQGMMQGGKMKNMKDN